MDNKLLLSNSIVLLYRESQFVEAADNSAELVKEIIEHVKLPELSIGMDQEKNILSGLKKTLLDMCHVESGHKYEQSELLFRLKVNCSDDESLYEALKDGLTTELSEESLKRICFNLRTQLRKFIERLKVTEIVNRASNAMRFDIDKINDLKAFLTKLQSDLDPYTGPSDVADPSILDDIDFSDENAVSEIYGELKEQESGIKIMRTGWQGLNRMLQGGFRRGEAVLWSALQHNYKTGFGLSILKHIALYNNAADHLKDPKKKPLLLRIGFEDAAKNNMQFLYQSLYENEFRQPVPNFADLKKSEISKYVREKMQINGWEVRILRVDPTAWTYRDIQNMVLKLESEGYEIVICQLDYLMLVPTIGCITSGPIGTDKRDLLRRTRNFMTRRDITFMTPHQMSTDAKQLVRDGRQEELVREVANKGYYEGSRQLDQEVDLELYLHIVKSNGKSWLTLQRGKHRVIRQTPDVDLYCCLPFDPVGGILDDVNGKDSTRRRVGGGTADEGYEQPFWA